MSEKQYILILEDDIDTRTLIKRRLKSKVSDIVLYEASDPLEALEIFHKHSSTLTHIISDNYMPKESGLNFCQLVKERKPEIKIFLISADSGLKKSHQLYYVDRFFLKPDGIFQIEKEITRE